MGEKGKIEKEKNPSPDARLWGCWVWVSSGAGVAVATVAAAPGPARGAWGAPWYGPAPNSGEDTVSYYSFSEAPLDAQIWAPQPTAQRSAGEAQKAPSDALRSKSTRSRLQEHHKVIWNLFMRGVRNAFPPVTSEDLGRTTICSTNHTPSSDASEWSREVVVARQSQTGARVSLGVMEPGPPLVWWWTSMACCIRWLWHLPPSPPLASHL